MTTATPLQLERAAPEAACVEFIAETAAAGE